MEQHSNTAVLETVGLDLGDQYSRFCVLDDRGETREEGRLRSTREGMRHRFEDCNAQRIVIETGTHSPWVNELLSSLGHEVIVANARRVRLISENERKTDRRDAELLARLGRVDPRLLHPIQHRGTKARTDLEIIRARATLVVMRTKLINHVRGAAKSAGCRLVGCSTKSFHKQAPERLTEELKPILEPMIETIEHLTQKINSYERQIEAMCERDYPETQLLRQVKGVGAISALCFVLTLEDPLRFKSSRHVGAYLGLVPEQDQSGHSDPELHITKAGDPMLRTLMVQCAHHIMGPFGEDCDLRRHGMRIASGGKKNAKKRALVAVARKLAVLLHCLWRSAEVYDPLRSSRPVDTPPTTAR
jgi:transposase